MDLDAPAFEAVGNDQNHKEVKKDQDGVTDFRFRYSLIAHASPYGGADAVAFATSVHVPLVWTLGCLPEIAGPPWSVSVDPRRAVATCLKPADDPAAGGVVLRLWETAGETAPLTVRVVGVRRAILTDLLERDQREIPIDSQEIVLPLPPHGYGAVRLQF
jgi:alpha-mannosidase